MTDSEPPEFLTAKQAASVIGISRPNLDKWLSHRGITPSGKADMPVGRLYLRTEIEAARDTWLSERDREADEKRRQAALANSAERQAGEH